MEIDANHRVSNHVLGGTETRGAYNSVQHAEKQEVFLGQRTAENAHDLDSRHHFMQSSFDRYTCPICLSEFDGTPGSQGFELTASCKHKFCVPCLYAYIHSKLTEGVVKIPCCHFKISDNEEDFHPCDITIHEADIHRVIFAEGFEKESILEEWCYKNNHDCNEKLTITGRSKETEGSKSSEPEELWTRYKKLQFDHIHGRDVVRRCPKCDEAKLFDVDAMKKIQAKLQAITSEGSTMATNRAGSGSNASSNRSVRQLERFLFLLGSRGRRNSDGERYDDQKIGTNEENGEEAEERIGGGSDELTIKYDPDTKSDTGNSNLLKPNLLQKSKEPTVKCQLCQTEFCYFHSNAHPGQSCEEYCKKTADQERANIEFASNSLHAKPCPNCGISVSKDGGCNQIKCGNCGTHFCWLCSKTIDDGAFPEHFRWWNVNGCPNMQLDESDEPYKCTMIAARTLSIVQLIVLGVPAFALAFATCILCPCVVVASGKNFRERFVNCISFWGSFLSTLVLFPFTCIGKLFMSVNSSIVNFKAATNTVIFFPH
ncbi:hypothetical protein ACHAXS_006646 [Conticribra weissflogii]